MAFSGKGSPSFPKVPVQERKKYLAHSSLAEEVRVGAIPCQTSASFCPNPPALQARPADTRQLLQFTLATVQGVRAQPWGGPHLSTLLRLPTLLCSAKSSLNINQSSAQTELGQRVSEPSPEPRAQVCECRHAESPALDNPKSYRDSSLPSITPCHSIPL